MSRPFLLGLWTSVQSTPGLERTCSFVPATKQRLQRKTVTSVIFQTYFLENLSPLVTAYRALIREPLGPILRKFAL